MKLSKNWKRIFAGMMAAIMVFLSVDAGCLTALAAEIQELNNGNNIERPTGYLALEQILVDENLLDGEIYSYEELAEIQTYTDSETSEWYKYSNYFYYNQLSEDWRKVWDALDLVCFNYLEGENDAYTYNDEEGGAIYHYLESVTYPESATTDELQTFVELFLNSNPQYYFLNNAYLVGSSEYEDGEIEVFFAVCVYEKFAVGIERAHATETFQAAIETVLSADELHNATSEADKLRYVHDYIVENVEYNHTITTDDPATDDVNESEISTEEDKEALSQSAFSALCMDETVCAGYAEALQLLCNALGIDTICVTSDDHQWNKVYINHTWYNVDATWADWGDENPIRYDYYLRSDEVYDDPYDVQHLSHKECDFYGNYLPACPLDTTPVNEWEAPGTLPQITEQTAAPKLLFTKAGINEETGEQRYMVGLEPTSGINMSNPARYYYTIDGSEPDMFGAKSIRYRNAFFVEGEYTIKIKAVQSGYLDSDVVVYTNVETLPKLENVANKSHFYQQQTFVWKTIVEADGYIIKVFNSADSTQIGEEIDITNGSTNFYLYDTSALAKGTSIYYEIYGYKYDESEQKVPITETTVSGKTVVNQLEEPLDVVVKWHVTTSDGSNLLVVSIEEDTQDKLCLWYFTDKNGINSLNNFTLNMTDGATEFKYSYLNHGVAYDEVGYVLITDKEKTTAFQDNGFAVGGEYKAPVLKPIADVQLESTGDSAVLKADIEEESLMKNFNYKYQWYVAKDYTSEGTPIEGATSKEYEVKIGSFDEKYYYCEVTAEYLTKHVYQTQNALAEDGMEANHTRVQGALFNTNITADKIADQVYDGTAKIPALTLRNELDKILVLDTDYTLQYTNNTNAGEATIEVDFIGAYEALENAVVNFKILPKQASKETLEFTDVQTGKEYIYNGTPFTPVMEVRDPARKVLLVPEGDYDITYNANTDAGTAKIILNFKGNYDGRVVIDFEIKRKSAENVTIDSIADQTFTGQPIIPALTIKDGDKLLEVNKDYKVTCTNNIHVATADVKIEFIGNYYYDETKLVTFDIIPRNASDVSITSIAKQEYTGFEIEPSLEVVYRNENGYPMVLTKGTNYTVTYSDNIELGTATVTLTFSGDFKGTRVETFEIVPKNAENLTYFDFKAYIYDGTKKEPPVVIMNGELTLVEGVDYIVEYVDNVNAGTGKAIVKFEGFDGCSGNYTGTKELFFQIAPKFATGCTVALEESLDGYTFTGKEFRPGVTVMDGEVVLKERTEDMEEGEGDYVVTYLNNINAGEATVKVTFINNYTGEYSEVFTIKRKPITEDDIEIEAIADQTYNGTMIVPENIVVKEKALGEEAAVILRPGIDYTVSAGDENTFVGTGVVLIHIELEGESNYIYEGEDLEATFTIIPRGTSTVEISEIPNQTYTGEAITPALELKDDDIVLIYGIDYTVTYENNIEVGTEAKAIISFMGNFKGEDMTATFTIINPIPEYITSSAFHINENNGYISKVTVGTTVYTLLNALNEREYVSIFDRNGSPASGDSMLTTGMITGIVDKGTVVKYYTVVVTGDTNGDGKINITDMIAVKACSLKKSDLTGAYEKAADVNGDGKINITDFIKVKATTLRKDTITGVAVN